MPNRFNIADIDSELDELEQLTGSHFKKMEELMGETLSKREIFASMANIDVDGYSQTYAEEVLGEKHPGLEDKKALVVFWAKFKCYLKVLEADLLIEALNKQP